MNSSQRRCLEAFVSTPPDAEHRQAVLLLLHELATATPAPLLAQRELALLQRASVHLVRVQLSPAINNPSPLVALLQPQSNLRSELAEVLLPHLLAYYLRPSQMYAGAQVQHSQVSQARSTQTQPEGTQQQQQRSSDLASRLPTRAAEQDSQSVANSSRTNAAGEPAAAANHNSPPAADLRNATQSPPQLPTPTTSLPPQSPHEQPPATAATADGHSSAAKPHKATPPLQPLRARAHDSPAIVTARALGKALPLPVSPAQAHRERQALSTALALLSAQEPELAYDAIFRLVSGARGRVLWVRERMCQLLASQLVRPGGVVALFRLNMDDTRPTPSWQQADHAALMVAGALLDAAKMDASVFNDGGAVVDAAASVGRPGFFLFQEFDN